MFEQPLKEEILQIIRELEAHPQATQRHLSEKLGVSLGKTNYLLKALVKKGFIKAKYFSSHTGKIQKIHYILTKKGFEAKLHMMYHFLKKKEAEYFLIKQEWERLAIHETGPASKNEQVTVSTAESVPTNEGGEACLIKK